jgi:hypothetical protein
MNVKKYVKNATILMLAVLVLLPANVFASEVECRSVLSKCDTAVKDLQKENALQAQIIKDEDDRFATQTKELNSEQFWRPIAIGGVVVIGVETLVLILKH